MENSGDNESAPVVQIDENNTTDNEVKGEVVDVSDNEQNTNTNEDNENVDNTQDNSGEEGSEKFKVFVGRLVNDITTDELKNYFSKFGEVVDVVLVHDNFTHKFRGFAFVRFSSFQTVNDILNTTDHSINGRAIDVKPATAKGGAKSLASESVEPNKIFVGGFSPEITKDQLIEIFSQFGKIVDVNIITEAHTNKSRGFCYITYENDEGRKKAVDAHKVVVGDANAEIKSAIPKEMQNKFATSRRNDRFAGPRSRRGGPRGGGRSADRDYNRRYQYRDQYPRYEPREYDKYDSPMDREYPYYRYYDRDRGRDYPPYDRPTGRFPLGRKDSFRGGKGAHLPYPGGYNAHKGQDEYYSYYQKQPYPGNKSGAPFNKRNTPQ